jgi:hypothetical protein
MTATRPICIHRIVSVWWPGREPTASFPQSGHVGRMANAGRTARALIVGAGDAASRQKA